MDPEENQREEKKQSESFFQESKEKMKSAGEKAQKAKKAFKIFMKLPTPIKIAIIAVPLVVIVLLLLFSGGLNVLDDLTFEDIFSTKASAMGSDTSYSKDFIKIKDGKWVLDMSDDIINKIKDAGIDTTGKSQEELLMEYFKLNGLEENDIPDGTLKLLPYFIKAELSTQQLDLRKASEMYNSQGEYNVPDTKDMDKNNEVCGTIHLKRINSKDMSKINLEYTDYETFKTYADNKNEAIKYFSFNDNGDLVIYTWTHTKYTYNNIDGKIEVPAEAKKSNSDDFFLQESIVDYKPLVSKYTLPFEVLTALVINSEDVEFAKKVADLAFESNIEIALVEEYEYSKTINTTKYYKTIREYQHLNGNITVNGVSAVNGNRINRKIHRY